MTRSLLSIFLPMLFIGSAALAQSAGGGLGGDKLTIFNPPKGTVIKPVQVNFWNKSCQTLKESVVKNRVIRLNFPSDISSVYAIVGSTRKYISCYDAGAIIPYQTDTVDADNCSLGYTCAPHPSSSRGH